jgi:D-arginine dehydrogenase
MDATADVIVIGGGMAGASVGAELARTRRVILLEREDRPGRHATGRSAALHSEIYGPAAIRALTRASREAFLAPEGAAPFATPRDCLHIAIAGQIPALETFAALPDVQAAVTRLDGAGARALAPLLKPGVVTAALREHNAYDLDVDAIHQHYLRALKARGGVLVCDAAVSGLMRRDGLWIAGWGEHTASAPIVIDAAGAWGDEVAVLAGVAPLGLQPMRRTIALVDLPDPAASRDWPMVIDIDEQFYFKPSSGQLLISPADETPMAPCDAWPEELDIAIAVDRIQQVADLDVSRVPHRWAGLRTFAPDRAPVVGFDPQADGFFWLVGQGGYGIQTAPAMARLAAALALGNAPPADLLAQGLDVADLSPERLRPRIDPRQGAAAAAGPSEP